MRAVIGIVSLLIALAIVGVLASRQLKTVRDPKEVTSGLSVSAGASGATVAEQSRNTQKKVADDMAKAMQDAANAREGVDK
jgi:multidrug efflux pump subunit AcrB